jgi:hypothetical protein
VAIHYICNQSEIIQTEKFWKSAFYANIGKDLWVIADPSMSEPRAKEERRKSEQ